MQDVEPRTIAIAALSETGHYSGSFRLARNLRARGHKIVYIGLADFEQLVLEQGFEFIPFAKDLLPAGYIAAFNDAQAAPKPGLLDRLRRRGSNERLFKAYLSRITDGPLDDCLLSSKPSLLICDTFVWYVALRAIRLKIPIIDFSPILSLRPNPRIPPIVTSQMPSDTALSDLKVRASWRALRLKFFFSKRAASKLLGWYRFPHRMHHLTGELIRIAKQSGCPAVENETYWFGEMGPRLVLPEIVLCPEAFQLPGAPERNRRYLSDFVDVGRSETPLEDGAIDPKKPLVYCSLGTASHFYPHAPRFYRAVAGAAKARQEWQFVLHVGDHPEGERLGRGGSNLLIRKRVPQHALLRDARVMVTHGGLNSIMECIHFGVPMVIFPGLRDQPGNAVRAAHYNIAVVSDMARVTPERIIQLAGSAMNDETLRKGLADMKARIAAEPGMGATIEFLESYTS